MLTWIVASYVFFIRSPNSALAPNFYAEDGIDYLTNIIHQGPVRVLANVFNGYFVVGIYVIGDLAALIDHILFGGEFIRLPLSIALASYIFLGLCSALPIITLNKILKPAYLGLAVLGLMFVPMPLNDNVVIGTLGNLKFAFAFLAILLIAKRWGLDRKNKLIPLLDFGVLICAYTTATVYLMLPFYLFSDGLRPRQLFATRKTWRLSNISLWSGATVVVLLLFQLAYVAIHGIPILKGYLDAPFIYSKSIEIFLGRSIIFGLTPSLYRHLNDFFAVAGIVLLVAAISWAARRWSLLLAILCGYSAIAASVLFLMNRPGLSGMFQHYTWSGPDQFFYAQTMMSVVLGSVLLQTVSLRLKLRWIQFSLFVLVAIALVINLPSASFYGKDKTWEATRGTIYTATKIACKSSGNTLTINSYPTMPWHVIASRSEVCTKALFEYKTYHVSDQGLAVHANNPVDITTHSLTQPFAVRRADGTLAGIQLFVSTYRKSLNSKYSFVLYHADCKTKVASTSIDGAKLKDNTTTMIYFKAITEESDYCFSLSSLSSFAQPLALQLSSTNPNSLTPASIGGTLTTSPVVYSLIFEDQ